MPGSAPSEAEVTNISKHGFWLLIDGRELFLPFAEFPWFRQAPVEAILRLDRPTPGHLHWPDLDDRPSARLDRAPRALPAQVEDLTLVRPWPLALESDELLAPQASVGEAGRVPTIALQDCDRGADGVVRRSRRRVWAKALVGHADDRAQSGLAQCRRGDRAAQGGARTKAVVTGPGDGRADRAAAAASRWGLSLK